MRAGSASSSSRACSIPRAAWTIASSPPTRIRAFAAPPVKARTEQRYDELVIVAAPKFLGALRGELGKEVEKLVVEELPKDLSWLNERQLEGYFAKGSGRAP